MSDREAITRGYGRSFASLFALGVSLELAFRVLTPVIFAPAAQMPPGIGCLLLPAAALSLAAHMALEHRRGKMRLAFTRQFRASLPAHKFDEPLSAYAADLKRREIRMRLSSEPTMERLRPDFHLSL